MKRLLLGFTLSLIAASAVAQSRPSTLGLSCRQAAGLVASRGAVVLSTGRYTYDRFVSGQRFCLHGETTEAVRVPTRDTPRCLIGYRCRQREFRIERND